MADGLLFLALNGVIAVLAAVAWFTRRRHRRGQRPRIPAAPDNQPGHDIDALWTCRRIGAQPTARKEAKP